MTSNAWGSCGLPLCSLLPTARGAKCQRLFWRALRAPAEPLWFLHANLIVRAHPPPPNRTLFLTTHPTCQHCACFASQASPAAARLGGRPRGGWSGAGHVATVSPCAHAPVTERRGGGEARPLPPGPAPAPRSAAPPPRGVPGRSSPQWQPRAARGRREYSRGRPMKRLPRGGAGRQGRVKGEGPAPPAGVDEVRGLNRGRAGGEGL